MTAAPHAVTKWNYESDSFLVKVVKLYMPAQNEIIEIPLSVLSNRTIEVFTEKILITVNHTCNSNITT